jgi:hypothetical protein
MPGRATWRKIGRRLAHGFENLSGLARLEEAGGTFSSVFSARQSAIPENANVWRPFECALGFRG